MTLREDLLGRCRFPSAGTVVTAAVSGGADSLALLLLAVDAGLAVTAVHVDHGLRPGSADEAALVGSVASSVGAAFRTETVAVAPGPNLEARARAARYAVLPPDVLTGHTLDDQAETVLLNLLRGAGIDGLAGMRDDGRRPLLALRRSETVALCAASGLVPFADPSNLDPVFRRNRVRHELLPLLDDIAARDIAPVLARQAGLLADTSDLLTELAASLDPTDCRALRASPPPLAQVALRAWLRPVADGHPPDAATVDRVLEVVRGTAVATQVGRGWTVRRSANRLTLLPPSP